MNPLARLINALKPTPVGLPAPASTAPLREAAGVNVDVDDDQWRRLTGDGRRDLSPITQERMQSMAAYLWQSNLLANRLVELPVAYLLAHGVSWRVDDDTAQAALDAHWSDGINAWDVKLPKRIRELSMFGEQCWPVFTGANGFVRVGYLDPARIETVVVDAENAEQPIGVVTKRDSHGNKRRYRVIVNAPESAFAETTRAIRETFTSGDCFFFRVNELCNGSRGRSDLLAAADWLDAYDVYMFGEIDRAQAQRAYYYDVTLTGATPDEVAARAAKIAAPKSGAVRVHNDAEAWKTEAPDLNAYDSDILARLIRNHILGGATLPEHWYGGAQDVNRATGDSMTEPAEKMLEMRQRTVGYMLECVGQYVLRAAWRALDRELTAAEAEVLGTLRVEWPELTVKDTTKYAAALQQVTAAAAQGIVEGLLTRETALRLIASIADRIGVDIEADTELEAAQAELAERGGSELDGISTAPPAVAPVPSPAAVE